MADWLVFWLGSAFGTAVTLLAPWFAMHHCTIDTEGKKNDPVC